MFKTFWKSFIKIQYESLFTKDNSLEEYHNNKYPKIDRIYKGRPLNGKMIGIDIRDFFVPYDSEIRAIAETMVSNDDNKALSCLKWVKDNIKYISDKGEYWQFPFETLYLKTGDCLKWDTKLLSNNKLKNIEDINVGNKIIGKNGKEVRVLKKWNKGKLETNKILLNNGTEIIATNDHKFILSDEKEVLAKDLRLGDKLKQIKEIELFNVEEDNEDYYYLLGLFVADGWIDGEHNAICISGKDGYPKEKQKEWVKKYCEKKGIQYYWHKRFIRVKSIELYRNFKKYGNHAFNKNIIDYPQNKKNIESLLNGLKADAYINKNGSITFGTISNNLKRDIRILYRMLGKSVHERLWQPTKTQFGKNPIWRITLRNKREVPLTITGIIRNEIEQVYDIEVDGNEIYLPENDCIVHNCEDGSILLANLMLISGIPSWKIRLTAGYVKYNGSKTGHAYLTYYCENENKWVILDWCYWPNDLEIKDRKDYKEEKNYLQVWFSWNQKYVFSKGLNSDAKHLLS